MANPQGTGYALGPNPTTSVSLGGLYAPATGSPIPNPVCTFVTNAAAPQLADYAIAIGIGFFCASALNPQHANAALPAHFTVSQQTYVDVQPFVTPPLAVNQGATSSAEYVHGTHVLVLADAENRKTWIQPSLVGHPPKPSPQIIVGQQSYVDSLGQVFVAQFKGTTPKPSQQLIVGQQSYQDSPALISTPLVKGATPNPAPIKIALEQAYQNPPAVQINAATKAVLTGPVIPILAGSPPQFDYTLQAVITASATNPQGISGSSEYIVGTHALALADAEGHKTQVFPSARQAAVLTGNLISRITASPQSFDHTLPAQLFQPLVVTGWISTQVSAGADSSEYVQLSPLSFSSAATPTAIDHPIVPVIITGQQTYNDPPALVQRALEHGRILGQWIVGQQTYSDPSSSVFVPLVGHTPKPSAQLIVGQQVYQDVPALTNKAATAHAPVSGLLGTRINAAPQPVDLTQQAVIQKSLANKQGPTVRPIVSVSPQAIDLTQQGWIQKAQPKLSTGSFTVWIAYPQVDLSVDTSWVRASSPVPPTVNSSAGPIKGYFYSDTIRGSFQAESMRGKFFSEIIKGYFS